MLTVYWLLQRVSDVPNDDEWLSSAERDVLAGFQFVKRRREWRLGRWTAKRALVLAGMAPVGGELRRVSIDATAEGVPLARIDGADAPYTISLSHSGDYGFCAVAEGRVALGCDVEVIGRRGEVLVSEYFTASERAQLPADDDQRSRVVTSTWSAKESAMKALGVGLRLDTRQVIVDLSASTTEGEWHPLAVRGPAEVFGGWWRTMDDYVLTLVAAPAPGVPVSLFGSTHG